MFKYKLLIQYDGTNYFGWQYQKPNKYGTYSTIQSELHQAIFELTKEHVSSAGAGRTDAGVHATKQVCHIELKKHILPEKLMEGLNYFLRNTRIVVYGVEIVDKDFHSRFQAKSKTYHYLIWNSFSRNIFYEKKAWHINKKIDFQRLQRELETFKTVGGVSFESFRDSFCQAKHAVRKIDNVSIEHIILTDTYLPNTLNHSSLIKLTFSAKSFLHHQVRIMVGTLIDICTYNRKHSIKDILLLEDRTKAGMTAPAHGLYLVDVEY